MEFLASDDSLMREGKKKRKSRKELLKDSHPPPPLSLSLGFEITSQQQGTAKKRTMMGAGGRLAF